MERRQHQPALAQVLVAVQDQDELRPDERLQERRAVAALQDVGRRGVDALDLLGSLT